MSSLLRRLCEWIHADRIPFSTLYGSENVTQICHDAAVCPSPPCQIFSNCVFRQALMTHQECFSCRLLFPNVIAFLCWNESEAIVTFVNWQTRAWGYFFEGILRSPKENREKGKWAQWDMRSIEFYQISINRVNAVKTVSVWYNFLLVWLHI